MLVYLEGEKFYFPLPYSDNPNPLSIMRPLTVGEKNICKQILKSNAEYISALFPRHDKYSMTVDFERETAVILVEGIFTETDFSEYDTYLAKVMEIILLVQLLESNGLLVIYHKNNRPLLLTTNDNFPRERVELLNFQDRHLKEYVLDIFGKTIIINEEFKSFCKNGFITRNEYREHRNADIANKAFWISIAAIVISMLALANDLGYIPRKGEAWALFPENLCRNQYVKKDSITFPKPPQLRPSYKPIDKIK